MQLNTIRHDSYTVYNLLTTSRQPKSWIDIPMAERRMCLVKVVFSSYTGSFIKKKIEGESL